MAEPKDDVPELIHFDPDVAPDDEGDELRTPTEDELAEFDDSAETIDEVANDAFDDRKPQLPQPARAASAPELPRVKASHFLRFLS